MEPRANYFIVGLFVIGLAVVAAMGVLWLSAGSHKMHRTYLTYMNESVSGLSVQAPVKFNGVEVGTVSKIQINPENSQQVRIFLEIEEDTPINQSTRALLMTQGITGVMFVGLKAGATKAAPLVEKSAEGYLIIPSSPSVLVELDTTLRELGEDMRKISTGFQELLNNDNQKAIHASLKNLDITLKNSQTVLQSFSQQMLPSMVNTMSQLDLILNRVEPFVSTLQDNPSVLVRGKAPATLGPGE